MMGYLYLDSGAMYRALALKALRRQVALDNESRLAELAKETHIELNHLTPSRKLWARRIVFSLTGRT